MFKKIILITAMTTLTTNVALANYSAPYLGASFGITNTTSNVKISTPNDFAGGSYRGVPFNLFVGYGGVLDQNFYLAGEVFGTVGTANLTDYKGLKTSYGYGASILPGIMLSDHTIAYARLGVVRSRFSKQNVTRTGGQAGLGLQTCLTQNIDIRGEYDYVAYKSVDGSFLNRNSWSLTPRSDQVTLGVVYKFD